MKLYRITFSTKHYNGGRKFHNAYVAIRKVKSCKQYKIKWDFGEALNSEHNRATLIYADDYISAIRKFVDVDMWFDPTVDIVGFSEITL